LEELIEYCTNVDRKLSIILAGVLPRNVQSLQAWRLGVLAAAAPETVVPAPTKLAGTKSGGK
jgi:hypothetical protein